MSPLAGRARRYLADIGGAFERAPAEVATAVTLAAALSWAIEAGEPTFERWLELAVCGALIIAGAWTATLLHALGRLSATQRWATTLGTALLVGVYGIFVIDFQLASEGWRAAMLLAAAVCFVAAAPFFGVRLRGEADAAGADDRIAMMRAVTGRFILRLIGAALYCAALYAGLALAIGAVNTLFELGIQGEIFGHVAAWIFVALAPWIVAGGVDDFVAPVPPRSDVASVVHRMAAFLVPPLFALYALILYAYAVRIGITGEVPNNIVSPMVFAAGILALLALLLFDPRPGGTAGERTLRAAPLMFVPLVVLGVFAITLRVGQYGWTEFRLLRLVLLVVLGLLAVGAAWLQFRRARFPLHIGPLALATALLLSAVGPWSVLAISRGSQQARFTRGLELAAVDPAAPLAADTARLVPAEVFDQVNDPARYLIRHFGPDAVPGDIGHRAEALGDTYNVAGMLGLRRAQPAVPVARHLFGHLTGDASIAMGGVTAHRVTLRHRGGPAPQGNISLDASAGVLRITVAGDVWTAGVSALLERLAVAERSTELRPTEARLDVANAAGALAGNLLVLDINIEITEQGEYVLRVFDGFLVVED